MADPWMKFYPQDWRADERLRNCSIAARGLWIELLALMHRSDRYGYLLVNGKQPTDRQIAIQAGASIDEVSAGIAELENEGVFSRDRHGTIYSRRMIRDEKKAQNARKNGRKGGNPKLGKQKENPARDNHQLNGSNKPQIPEARSQKPEVIISSSNEDVSDSRSDAPPAELPDDNDRPLTVREVVEAWNERMVPQGFPAVQRITGTRERQLRARIRENTVDDFQRAMAALERSAFCRGENDRGWRADFDFFVQPKSFTKLLEGAFDH